MITLSNFFKGSDTTLGIFYPKHYVIAVFGNLEVAQRVVHKLRNAGFVEEDVIAATGRDIIDLAEAESGLGSFFMQALSRFLSTEQKYTDHDLMHAHHGAGFLAVHCPTESLKKEAWEILAPEAPLDARFYGNGGVEHLAGDFDTD